MTSSNALPSCTHSSTAPSELWRIKRGRREPHECNEQSRRLACCEPYRTASLPPPTTLHTSVTSAQRNATRTTVGA